MVIEQAGDDNGDFSGAVHTIEQKANAQANIVIVVELGALNDFSVSQEDGAVNSASVFQFGADNNVASSQVGDQLTLSVTQNNNLNQVFSVQLGVVDGLSATQTDTGALGNTISNIQIAEYDTANVALQRGFNDVIANSQFLSDDTLTVALQDGFKLAIANVQAGPGDTATVSLQAGWADRIANGQNGANDILTVTSQSGVNLTIVSVQDGAGDRATLSQSGSWSVALLTQSGAGDADRRVAGRRAKQRDGRPGDGRRHRELQPDRLRPYADDQAVGPAAFSVRGGPLPPSRGKVSREARRMRGRAQARRLRREPITFRAGREPARHYCRRPAR